MGVTRNGLVKWMPEMSSRTHCTDSSVDVRYQQAQAIGHPSRPSSNILDGELQEAVKLKHRMRLELGQEELGHSPGIDNRGYSVADQGPSNLTNLLLKSGAGHELSMSLPNLNASLETGIMNRVNEKQVRSSLSDICDGKPEICTKQSLTDLSKCIKTLSTEDFKGMADGRDGHHVEKMPLLSAGGNLEDLKIDVHRTNNRLSAVLENMPLLYIPHTKQLVSISPQSHDSPAFMSKDDPTSNNKMQDKTNAAHQRNGVHSFGGDVSILTRNGTTENGSTSPTGFLSQSGSNVVPVSPQNCLMMDGSLGESQTNLPNLDSDMFTLSQDSDASSSCRSEHTVVHQDDIGSQEQRDPSVDFDTDSIGCFSKISLERESPRNTIRRTNTMGSLSKADASSFSSISSISTGTDFSASAASYSDDYLEMRGGVEVDDAGFMDVNLHSRNTFERSKNSSQDSGIDEKQCLGAKPKRRGISSFFARNLFSRKTPKEITDPSTVEGGTSSAPGWKLFGRVPPKHVPQKDSNEITKEYQAKVKVPQHPIRGKRPDVEAPSTTALILENRPSNLPSKDPEEELRHRQEYEAMVEASKKRELREAKLRKKQQQQQLKQEEALAAALRVWNSDVLPNWDNTKSSKKTRDLWWQGIPPAVRGKVWQLAIGNELNLTPELYEICLNRARDRMKLVAGDTDSGNQEPSSSKEASVEVIKLDVSRTFPQLCIFQKGGPYHELLHGLLGAYACYRPDIGYVQGMSFIAAVLLLNMEVADAFICFANLLNRPCQIAFFRLDESLMKSYFLTYEEFFKENLPRLFSHFQKQSLTPDLYIIDWMFTLYAKSLPLDVASRVWDVFCRDGEEFLFRTALGILKMHEDILMSLDFIHLAQFLTKLPENISAETLFRSVDSVSMVIDKKRFVQVLAQFREPKDT